MQRFAHLLALGLLLGALLLTIGFVWRTADTFPAPQTPTSIPVPTETPVPVRTPCAAWDEVAIPANGGGGVLAAVGAHDIWSMGSPAVHWDGTAWNAVPVPQVGSGHNSIASVAGVAADDVWAVGYYGSNPVHSMILHWDGIAWSRVPIPMLGSGSNVLNSVAAVAADDVWAVGYYLDEDVKPMGPIEQNLVLHWDGTAWSVVPSPNVGLRNNFLYSVVAVSADDIWVVGNYGRDSALGTLTLHWDGIGWGVVTSPNIGPNHNRLYSVAATGADDIWAVGQYMDPGPTPTPVPLINGESVIYGYNAERTLVLHWDGKVWSVVPSAESRKVLGNG